MARQRIAELLSRGSTTPQSIGFRFVTRPFAAEPWQRRLRSSAKRQTPEPDPTLQPRVLNAVGEWIEKAGAGVATGEQERSSVPRAAESEGTTRGSDEAAPPRCAGAESVTGLPENVRAGIESLSGLSMGAVKVHYDSARPFPLDALAYTRGTEIHLRPGQEKHLMTHEAWHVVQQLQGRVRPTWRAQDGVAVNDDARLEKEADVMGEEALRIGSVRRIAGASSPPNTVHAGGTTHDTTSIDPAMHASRPVAITGWLGSGAARRLTGGAGSFGEVVQCVQAPPNPPKTEWNKAHKVQAKGNVATDSWLSYRAGDAKPVGNLAALADPPGYTYIRNLHMTKLWIRFHLVNGGAGGPGTASNLIVTSQKTNQHPDWKAMEKVERAAYQAGGTYHFAVKVGYHVPHPHPNLPGHHWQEYFPKQIDAAFSTWKAAGVWQTKHMTPIVPNLPPMNPKQIDYELTKMSGAELNRLLETDGLGGFIQNNAQDLAAAMDEDSMISDLQVLIADIDESTARRRARKRILQREFNYAHGTLHDFLNGIGIANIQLK